MLQTLQVIQKDLMIGSASINLWMQERTLQDQTSQEIYWAQRAHQN